MEWTILLIAGVSWVSFGIWAAYIKSQNKVTFLMLPGAILGPVAFFANWLAKETE